MSVLLICCSNSLPSINSEFMEYVSKEGNFDSLRLSDYEVPMFSKYLEIPESINKIYSSLFRYKRLVFFSPEHNGYIPAFFKNIIDWLSIVKKDFLFNKDIVFVSVSITSRDKRIMEDGIVSSFKIFGPKSFEFVNVNRFGVDQGFDEKRAVELSNRIRI
ncbi:NADPH-dependent FMN reductase [Mycoplasma haemocanis str. Illinois]|uniref:NADPH-dependent FMN reductase n=1 Tax=Mycoplasma haemocanis (strain Illinois) TaxID=1111676 RepID=H6N5U5_MYCHN|nr:NAD(P)H-dependent oxidoreductase [Mycoplasma haemocanis]AEW45055.1 NADPH-dependent FMN reductase [Mycoplasma haemocanis str. Illinois]